MVNASEILLGVAGLGSLAAAVAHSVLGERLFVPQIQAQMTWPGGTRAGALKRKIVRIAWHATSVIWLAFAALLLAPLFGFKGVTAVYAVAASAFAVIFVMTGPVTGWRHLGWPVFAIITLSLIAAIVLSP